jgi:hypothetical protein
MPTSQTKYPPLEEVFPILKTAPIAKAAAESLKKDVRNDLTRV